MRHLQRFSSFDQDAVLSADPRAHHHRRRGGQPQGAGAGDAQNGDGGPERQADGGLGSGDLLAGALRREQLSAPQPSGRFADGAEIYRKVLLQQAEVAEAQQQPGGERQQGDRQDERNKEAAQPLRQLLDGRLSRAGPTGQRWCRIS